VDVLGTGLREDMIRARNGRGDPGGEAADGPMRRRGHVLLAAQVVLPYIVVYMNKLRHWTIGLLNLVELGGRGAVEEESSRGRHIGDSGSASRRWDGGKDAKSNESILKLMEAVEPYIRRGACVDKPS